MNQHAVPIQFLLNPKLGLILVSGRDFIDALSAVEVLGREELQWLDALAL